MSKYILGRIKKETMHAQLVAHKSKYAILYENPYPKKDKSYSLWMEKIEDQRSPADNDTFNIETNYATEITYEDSVAIVNWVYRIMSNAEEREEFTKELFKQIKDFYEIKNKIKFVRGVVYNSTKVDVHFFTSVSATSKFISSLKTRKETLFFRGHSDANYTLCPSIMRMRRLYENESKLYNELQIECPNDFEKCYTHLEKLVKMQHYGLPTRLLDITRNPLVALYFACESHMETYGELILISAENHDIKYPQSDTVSIIASLSAFPYEKQKEFRRLAEDPLNNNSAFNNQVQRLIHEVQLEKPAFRSEINKTDILNNYIVYALKNNNRIVKQDGAFILCGLSAETGSLETFRYKEHGKKIVVLIDKKEKILGELKSFSINRATLFPEIESVAEYLKDKYTH